MITNLTIDSNQLFVPGKKWVRYLGRVPNRSQIGIPIPKSSMRKGLEKSLMVSWILKIWLKVKSNNLLHKKCWWNNLGCHVRVRHVEWVVWVTKLSLVAKDSTRNDEERGNRLDIMDSAKIALIFQKEENDKMEKGDGFKRASYIE